MLSLFRARLVSASSKCSVRWKFSSSRELIHVRVLASEGSLLCEQSLELNRVDFHLNSFYEQYTTQNYRERSKGS